MSSTVTRERVAMSEPATAPARVPDADDLWAELRASVLFLFGGLALTAGVVGLLLPALLGS